MRRTVLLLAVVATAMLLGRGVALAATSTVADSTPQTDGIVFSVLPVGNRIYLGGMFTHVDGVPRDRLAAINATTGKLTNWNPGADKKVFALAASADGSRIYAGGAFSTVGGLTRKRLAAIDATTGAVDTTFKSAPDKAVRAIVVSGNRLYIGGDFTAVKGQSRARLALLDATTGALDANWTPAADDTVRALVASPNGRRIYAGGRFTSISGESRLRLAALEPTNTGSPLPWRTLANPNGPIIDLAVSGTRVYTAAGGAGGGAAEAWEAATGARAWQLKGDGDFQAITVTGGKAYLGGHFLRLGGQERRFFAAADAGTGALDPQWTPRGGGAKLSEVPSTGVWDLVPDEARGRLYAGTNFSKVNRQPHAGFVQFSQ